MTWVDLAVIGVLLVSAMLACLRGFVREVLGVAAWVGAAFVAADSSAYIQPLFSSFSAEPPIVDALSLGFTFIISLLVFSLVAMFVSRFVRGSVLGSLDRTLGLFYGLVRGAVLVIAAYIAVGMGIHVDRWPPPVLQSRSMGLAYAGAELVVGLLPSEYRPPVQAPPATDSALTSTGPSQGYTVTGRGKAAAPGDRQ